MKNIFVLLFPQTEYLINYQEKDIKLFNECIKKRYIDNGYLFYVVLYNGSDNGFISLNPNRTIEADITFEQSTPYTCKEWRYANFPKLAKDLELSGDDNVVLGGFHCNDCVVKLANEISKLNKRIIIDSDLTERFWHVSRFYDDWDISRYNADLQLKSFFEERKASCDINGLTNRIIEKFSNTIWGVSEAILTKIKQLPIEDEEGCKI